MLILSGQWPPTAFSMLWVHVMLVWSSVVAGSESVPVNPSGSISARGLKQAVSTLHLPFYSLGDRLAGQADYSPYISIAQFQGTRLLCGCALLRVWGSRVDGALAATQCGFWSPKQTLHIVFLFLLSSILKFLFNYTSIKHELR